MADSFGYLTVLVATALNTIPIPDALVTVTQNKDGAQTTIRQAVTDISGKTSKIQLPAPPRVNSLTPNPLGPSYSLYNVTVQKDGYYPVSSQNIPIFAGITSVQTVNLVPFVAGEEDGINEAQPEVPPSENGVNPEL